MLLVDSKETNLSQCSGMTFRISLFNLINKTCTFKLPIPFLQGLETMTLVHIVLFEFKPTTESSVVQDVGLPSQGIVGHTRGRFEPQVLA